MIEGVNNYIAGGLVGGLGNVGTKGKTIVEKAGKWLLGQAFTRPVNQGIEIIRNYIS